jgi:hypothetical protein
MEDDLFSNNYNFQNFLRNQKLKESFKHMKFNTIINLLENIQICKEKIKSLKDKKINIKNKNNNNNDNNNFNNKGAKENININNIIDASENNNNNNSIKDLSLSLNEENNNNDNNNSEIISDTEIENMMNNFEKEENDLVDSSINNNNNSLKKQEKILDNLIFELKNDIYNVNGTPIKTKSKIYISNKEFEGINPRAKIRYNIEMNIKDLNYERSYEISLYNINADLTSKLESLRKNTEIFILNLRPGMPNGNKIELFQTLQTKIFIKINPYADLENPLFIDEDYKIYFLEKDLNKNNNDNNALKNGLIQGRKKVYLKSTGNIIDLTPNNEMEYMDILDNKINEDLLKKFPNELKDFSRLLEKDVENTIYTISNSLSINKGNRSVDICGMISFIKEDDKIIIIELISLKDSNFIKVIYYKKNKEIQLMENMLIVVSDSQLKINKNYDILIELQNERNLSIIGKLNPEESNRIRKFRYDQRNEYNSFISLISNRIIRSIKKVV